MEYYKEKYRAGEVDFRTYERMLEIVAHLEQNDYQFIESIGSGSFGSVMKVKHIPSGEIFAAKIVQK